MDTGNNGQMLQMNVEAIAEVKVLTSAIRPNTDARAGCRLRPSPRAGPFHRRLAEDVERDSDWNENTWANIQNNVVKTIQKERDLGYSLAGRSATPAATTSCSSSTSRIPPAREREPGEPVPRADRGRTGRRLLVVDRSERRPDSEPDDYTTGAPFPGKVIPQGRLYQPGLAN